MAAAFFLLDEASWVAMTSILKFLIVVVIENSTVWFLSFGDVRFVEKVLTTNLYVGGFTKLRMLKHDPFWHEIANPFNDYTNLWGQVSRNAPIYSLFILLLDAL